MYACLQRSRHVKATICDNVQQNVPVGPQDVEAGGRHEVLGEELDELPDQGEVAHAAQRLGLLLGVW